MSPYMFRALKAHLQVETLYVCGIWYLTLYESSLWPIGAQFEWELTRFPLNCAPIGHNKLWYVTV